MKDQSDEDDSEKPDLRAIGEGLGFGNTAWGTSSGNGYTRPVVTEVDEDVTTTNADSDSGNVTSETEELVDDAETKSAGDEKIVEDKVENAST